MHSLFLLLCARQKALLKRETRLSIFVIPFTVTDRLIRMRSGKKR